MRIILRFAAVFILASSLFAQTPVPVSTTKEATIPAPAQGPSSLVPQQAAPADVAPNTPIVTLMGVCDQAVASKGTAAKKAGMGCKTVITKAQMDALLDILLPGAPPDSRHQFALNYIRMVAASSVAQEKHLEKDPAVAKELEARLQFTRMQVLAGTLYHHVEKVADEMPEPEIEKYYADHASFFVQGEVQRLTFPKSATAGTPLDLVMLKSKAEEYRARAAKGEEIELLQKDAVQALTPGGNVPSTKSVTMRRMAMPAVESAVFDLKPGEVTQVLEIPSGFEVLKLVSTQPLPLDAVRADIKSGLMNGRLQAIMKDSTKDVSAAFNLAYLSLPSAPELFLAPSLNRTPAKGAAPSPGVASGRPGATSMPTRRRPALPNGARPLGAMPPR